MSAPFRVLMYLSVIQIRRGYPRLQVGWGMNGFNPGNLTLGVLDIHGSAISHLDFE
jgi:hypothetical protein